MRVDKINLEITNKQTNKQTNVGVHNLQNQNFVTPKGFKYKKDFGTSEWVEEKQTLQNRYTGGYLCN